SEGRRIVREIENETFEENPPLFREYVSASPEIRVLMDNQFKNVKTHARLLSKAMWYDWRMKLRDGLKEGLQKTADDMDEDEKILQQKQDLLDSVLPALIEMHDGLEKETGNLELFVRELADCDPEELRSAREELVNLDEDIAAEEKEIADLEAEFE